MEYMTMRFLMFIKHAENSHEVTPPKPLMDAMETFVGEGVLVPAAPASGASRRALRGSLPGRS